MIYNLRPCYANIVFAKSMVTWKLATVIMKPKNRRTKPSDLLKEDFCCEDSSPSMRNQ